MEKKRKISIILMVIGAICAIIAAVMSSAPAAVVREAFWVPIAVGVLPLVIGIIMWLND